MTAHATPRFTAWGRALAAVVMAVFALVATTTAAGAATGQAGPASHPGFRAQAKDLGLNGSQARTLQDRVDGYLATTGGTQVAVNKIALKTGGQLLLALPGEERAREVSPAGADRLAAIACPYTYVCAYSGTDFTGDVFMLYTCDRLTPISWTGTGSWINNQNSTLHARFYNSAGNVGWTSPGGYSEDRAAPWGWVYWLSPC